jgi:hypothetical protein
MSLELPGDLRWISFLMRVSKPAFAYCYTDAQLINLQTLLLGADANGTWTETSTIPSQGAAFNAPRTGNQH